MLTLLHISDLHFGPPYVPRVGEALLAIAPALAPDCIVVSGDLTQRAKRAQFEQARAFLARLPDVPRVVVPGNHDVPLWRMAERLRRPFDLYREHVDEEVDHVCRLDGAVMVCLNSTSPRRTITNGRIHLDQLDLCEQALGDLPEETVRIVVAHHHFAPAPDYERDQVMPKSKRALDRLVALRVDLILGGHLHRAYIGNSLDVYPGADREHGIIIVQCGTTTSRRGRGREREKNSFNLVRLDGGMIDVTHFIFFDDEHAFAPASRHSFPRPGRRFPVNGR
ncbi:MAG: metallophosphoesterase family protein [Planctomycetota bacterium]|jgi:3',5'-cyclic AMP phosphodiesterase CpdA